MALIKGGLYRNVARRSILAQDEPWWNTTVTDWKLAVEHPYTTNENVLPDYWMDRALDLCETELTHQYFGLTFNDLMAMDPATFSRIEKRVYDFASRQEKKMPKELKEELKARGAK